VTKTAFLDTNVLMHSVPLDQIVWTKILDADEAELVVSPVVADELEEKKHDPQRWRRELAAKAARQIQDILAAGGRVREGVTLKLESNELGAQELRALKLLWEREDDRVLGCALAYRGGDKTDLVIVSRDHAFLTRAGAQGFATHRLDERYKLPPTQDSVDAENKRLKARVGELELSLPRLELAFADGTKEQTVSTADQTASDIAKMYVAEFEGARQIVGQSISPEYARSDYLTFGDRIAFEEWANKQAVAEEAIGRVAPLRFVLTNDSHVEASGVRVRIRYPAGVEDVEPTLMGPVDPPFRPPGPNRKSTEILAHMPRFVERPMRPTQPDKSGTPGIIGPHAVPGMSDALAFQIQGVVGDRDTTRFPEVNFLFKKPIPEQIVLKYEIVATGVPGKFEGALTIRFTT
jgi:hypothetical protein